MNYEQELEGFLIGEDREYTKAIPSLSSVHAPVMENRPARFSSVMLTSKVAQQAILWYTTQQGYQPTRDDMPPIAVTYFSLQDIDHFLKLEPTVESAITFIRDSTHMLSAATALFCAADKGRNEFGKAYEDLFRYREQYNAIKPPDRQPRAIIWLIRVLVRKQPNGNITVQGGHHVILDKPELHARPYYSKQPAAFKQWVYKIIPQCHAEFSKYGNPDVREERYEALDKAITETKLPIYTAARKAQQYFLPQGSVSKPTPAWYARVIRLTSRCSGCGYYYVSLKACALCRKARYCSPECQEYDWTDNRHKKVCHSK